MKPLSKARSLRFALFFGLIAPQTFYGCAAETASHEEIEENENEAYEASLESAPEFGDADDSLRRPTWAGNLSSGLSKIGQFGSARKFISFTVAAPEAQNILISLSTPYGSVRLGGYRLALYRSSGAKQPTGRALAVGTSQDGGQSVELRYANGSETDLVLVAYRLSNGSTRGTFLVNMSSTPAAQSCNLVDDSATCEGNAFCKFETGTCTSLAQVVPQGVCTPRPDFCLEIYSPVCGCDGQTYSNECDAESAGVSIAHEGQCDAPDPDKSCGPTVDNACAANEYCEFGPSHTCGGVGQCQPRPEVCTQNYQPVCGCDGQTYSNACHAAVAGVSVSRDGACNPPPLGNGRCGGLAGLVCGEGQYCKYQASQSCGAGDQMGTCETKPDFCTQNYEPVCGCDGQTYSNACHAAIAGTSVASPFACR